MKIKTHIAVIKNLTPRERKAYAMWLKLASLRSNRKFYNWNNNRIASLTGLTRYMVSENIKILERLGFLQANKHLVLTKWDQILNYYECSYRGNIKIDCDRPVNEIVILLDFLLVENNIKQQQYVCKLRRSNDKKKSKDYSGIGSQRITIATRKLSEILNYSRSKANYRLKQMEELELLYAKRFVRRSYFKHKLDPKCVDVIAKPNSYNYVKNNILVTDYGYSIIIL